MSTSEVGIFEQSSNECNWTKDDPIKSCLSLHRLVAALSYYSTVSTEEFDNFIAEVYNKQLLEDYAHLIDEHNDDLYAISDRIKNENTCSIKTCLFSLRHHRCAQVTEEHKIKENKLKFYADTLDSLHFYFYHLFECGMRSKINKKQEDRHYDETFAQMVKTINGKRKYTQMFDRFAVGNKFNLINDQTNYSNTTFLDEAVIQVKNSVFESFLFEEAFDSDGIQIDVVDSKTNLFTLLQQENAIECMQEIIKNVKRQKNTFSIGWRFYYWTKYEKNEKYDDAHVDIKICDLFIQKKFSDFKTEIFAYDNITKEEYEITLTKALELEKTKKVKTTTARSDWCGISRNVVIGLWHLIAIILYTDFSDHCSQFSASFRSLTPFETLDVTKKRNANFYWMARYLREAVEVFGRNRQDGINDKSKGMYGPFYCGINRRMVIPEFNLRLNAPTSTTKQMEVALKFGGSDGTILQLNNDSDGWHDELKAFNVSCFSRYRSEEERLFIGGRHRIRVQTIRLIRSKKNFKHCLGPLYYLDAMITGAYNDSFNKLKIDKNGYDVIKHLFDYKMRKETNEAMDPYIYETFDAYCANKKEIYIRFYGMNAAKDFMRGLIMYSFEKGVGLRRDSDQTNLLRPVLATIFPNVKKVRIWAAYYSFSLILFLGILQVSNWENVRIDCFADGWLSKLWQSSQKALIETKYESNNYKIEYDGKRILIIKAM